MSRPLRVLIVTSTAAAIAAFASACGTEKILVPKSAGPLYQGAVLFSQRCAGCHTLSYAATNGSATNVRTREFTNGPNFDSRCERTSDGRGVDRVLYAIENGGFSGAIMPQNVVVGQDAIDVAEFVATYAGRHAPKVPGVPACDAYPVGSPPPPASVTTTTASTTTTTTAATTTTTAAATTTTAAPTSKPASAKHKKKRTRRR